MKPLRVLFFLGIVAFCARPAAAQRAYFDGTNQSNGTLCPVTGTAVTVIQTSAGYYTDPNEPYPKTGDLAYVRVRAFNVSPCVNDAVGFEFFPPEGASLAIDATFQVYCYRGRTSDGYIENVPNSTNSSCSQSPSIGTYGGYFFGYSALPPGWYLDIRVPLVFNKKLLGLAGPNSHRLSAATSSAYGNLFPYQPVTVFYETDFENFSSSGITSSSANLAFTLKSYYHAGSLYVDYGTTNPPTSSLAPASVPDTNVSFSINSVLNGLNPATTYYWRARYVTSDGTFTSTPVQSFTTGSIPPPATPGNPSPSNGATGVSTSASLTWTASGATSYAVRFGTSNPPGQVATGLANPSYTPAGMQPATIYYWQIVASNGGGPTTGPVWSFTTQAASSPPVITTQPRHQKIGPGQTATLSVVATSSTPLTYQWYAGTSGNTSSPVGGGASTYMTPALSTSTSYWVRVTNSAGSVDSNTAFITVATSTSRRVPNDFNHDGLSDLGVFRPSLGRWVIAGQPVVDWGAAGDVPVAGDFNGDGHPDIAVFRPANGTWYIYEGATILWGAPGDIPVPGDYDGDGTTDIAVFRPSSGLFYIRNGATIAWGRAGDLPVVGDYNGDRVDDIAVYRPSTGTWFIRNITTVAYGFAADLPVPADYNGDGTTDIAVFRPSNGTWYLNGGATIPWGLGGDVPVPLDRDSDGIPEIGVFRRATGMWHFKNRITSSSESVMYGAPGDIPLGAPLPPAMTGAGDFDGDRKADLTVFRPSTGDWVTLRSLSGFADYTLRTFGLNGDIPVARDYDGDGKIDPAVFRPSTNVWYMLRSSTNFTDYLVQNWGLSGDIPVPGDYDGDGKADVAVFRPSLGRWVILQSSTNNTGYLLLDFGLNGDIPVPADYDGDGRTDIAVFRPSTGDWYIYNRVTGGYQLVAWGLSGDVPAPADFDGDGKADVTVFRPSLGRWLIKSSIDGTYQAIDWGLSGDTMVPADFDGDGKADVAVFRPSTGFWYVRGQFNRSWGMAGDMAGIKIP